MKLNCRSVLCIVFGYSDSILFISRPFYGYHDKEKQFLKLEFYNPAMMKRATELLQVSGLDLEMLISVVFSFLLCNAEWSRL